MATLPLNTFHPVHVGAGATVVTGAAAGATAGTTAVGGG